MDTKDIKGYDPNTDSRIGTLGIFWDQIGFNWTIAKLIAIAAIEDQPYIDPDATEWTHFVPIDRNSFLLSIYDINTWYQDFQLELIDFAAETEED